MRSVCMAGNKSAVCIHFVPIQGYHLLKLYMLSWDTKQALKYVSLLSKLCSRLWGVPISSNVIFFRKYEIAVFISQSLVKLQFLSYPWCIQKDYRQNIQKYFKYAHKILRMYEHATDVLNSFNVLYKCKVNVVHRKQFKICIKTDQCGCWVHSLCACVYMGGMGGVLLLILSTAAPLMVRGTYWVCTLLKSTTISFVSYTFRERLLSLH